MPPSKPTVRIVDRDGNVVEIVGQGTTPITIIAELQVVGSTLILKGVHVDGRGPGSSSVGELREMARELGRQHGAKEVTILGAKRTTGAAPGKTPRPITIRVD